METVCYSETSEHTVYYTRCDNLEACRNLNESYIEGFNTCMKGKAVPVRTIKACVVEV